VLLLTDSDGKTAGEQVDEFDPIVLVGANASLRSLWKLGIERIESAIPGVEVQAFKAVSDLAPAELLLERQPVLFAR